ncbi:MAG: arylsulfatase, partial [Phycisphaerales bacterium]
AKCAQSRAALLSGLYHDEVRIGALRNCWTLAEAMREAGFFTIMTGKWHLSKQPTDRGFDRYFGLISGAANYFDISKTKAEGVRRKMALDDQPYTPPKEGFYMTDAFTDHAVKFLDEHESDEQPFFLYLPYTAPHWPLHAWPEDIAKYQGKYRKGWDALRRERRARMVEMGLIKDTWAMSPRDTATWPWADEKDKDLLDLKMAIYAAQIERMDAGIGRVLEKIEAMGRRDNTLVMFLADNGGCAEGGPVGFDNRKNGLPPGGVDSYMSYGLSWANASNTPFRRYKHWVHEGGIATPFIASWPGVIKNGGAITHEVGHIIDVMATCVDAAGAKYPKTRKDQTVTPLEGKSLLPIFRTGKRVGHDALFWEHEGNRAVRQGKWKLVSAHGGAWELYDLEADRTELNNLIDKQPDKAKELEALYQTWAKRCGVRPWPIKRPKS